LAEIRFVLAQLELFREEKNLQIDIGKVKKYQILSDKDLLSRILINLLSNAIKFSPQNEKIYLKTEDFDEKNIKISITDFGEGILADQQEKIFDKFEQANSKAIGKMKATGLGLAFCKLAVSELGGKIGVKSEPQKGAEFWFTVEKISLSHETVNTIIEKKTAISLLKQEMKTVEPYILQMQEYEIYKFTEINRIINSIPETTENITLWKNTLKNTVLTQNSFLYKEMIRKVNCSESIF
jgi:signal transduction histidine kinase